MRKLTFLIGALFYIFQANAQTGRFVVNPYLQFGTKNSIKVLWETSIPGNSIVEYGPAQFDAESANISLKTSSDENTIMHEVLLENLEEETPYFYKVTTILESGDKLETEVSTFKTAVSDNSAFAFAVFSDSQGNPDVWGKLTTLAWEERPDFAIHAGDLVSYGYMKDDWVDEYLNPSNTFTKRYPIFSVPGNHEVDAPFYYQYSANPEPEFRYTFKYGNAEFFMVDTNRDIQPGSVQYQWLEWQLAKSDATWKFVVHHHPPYSSEANDFGDTEYEKSTLGDTDIRNLVPLYEKYLVDIVFYGHIHTYERTWPIFQNKVNQQKGVLYLNVGGAGGHLEIAQPTRAWFTRKVKSTHHFGYLSVFDKTIEFQAIDVDGKVFDSFAMQKSEVSGVNEILAKEPPTPMVLPAQSVFPENLTVEMQTLYDNMSIRYTLDGSEPTKSSMLYKKPFTISETTTVKAVAFNKTGKSQIITKTFEKEALREASNVSNPERGLDYTYFEGEISDPADFNQLQEIRKGKTTFLNFEEVLHRNTAWGVSFDGFVKVDADGVYYFEGHAAGYVRLYVDGKLLLSDKREDINVGTEIALKEGYHKIKVEFYSYKRGEAFMDLFMEGPELERAPISPMKLYRESK
ncbi:MAG: metallophosphoesterase [Thalassobius sp.]|nr:metallophosphoesterase [Thalassovita sp.]